jgi:histidinol dehydrogenase
MRLLFTNTPDFPQTLAALLAARKSEENSNLTNVVREIIDAVRQQGDVVLRQYTQQFDRHPAATLRLSKRQLTEGAAACAADVREALAFATERIRAFHAQQALPALDNTDAAGLRLGLTWHPIERVGLYVPGGRASYPSSVLMNAIPAQVAGVEQIALCVPTPEGVLNPAVLAAAQLLGIEEIYTIGGAQAVAAMAYGTQSLNAVDKIVGPGNQYVAEAKRQVFGKVGIDSIAGPSEVLIVADAQANPAWLAMDLLAQAEHDPAAQSLLITDSATLADAVLQAVETALPTLSTASVARQSWTQHGAVLVVDRLLEDSVPLINRIAPEHLQLCVAHPDAYRGLVHHAGSVFLGYYTPEALGDYLAGPNHVLPTMGTARFASGLSVYDFVKRTTWLSCPEAAFKGVGSVAETLAKSEGLAAHAASLALRLL